MNSIKQHEFSAEWVDDEHGPAIMLRQADEGFSEPATILVHPWQFRATCEHFGILPTGDQQARKTIATLSRRLLVLAERIGDLRDYVAKHSDHEHADLHAEMVMLNAAGDLAEEWAREVSDYQAECEGNGPAFGTVDREKRDCYPAGPLDGMTPQKSPEAQAPLI